MIVTAYDKRLHRLTVNAMKKAYAPYSRFFVGAALVTKTGKIYSGCNVENVCASAGTCAERTALAKAVSEGHHVFQRLYLVTRAVKPVSPCGICLQMLSEFCPPEMPVIVGNSKEILFQKAFGDFLPYPYLRKDRVKA